ncbi:MAG: hypothetical protein UX89_C0004G0001 [Parcubacteria group bacterium GW2011_GWA2_47_16]|nr:MAG: hypothetical protein UX89_C0004G0001 [Parcubacteria group bacterium GW2011_GWA2_47_16]
MWRSLYFLCELTDFTPCLIVKTVVIPLPTEKEPTMANSKKKTKRTSVAKPDKGFVSAPGLNDLEHVQKPLPNPQITGTA